MNLPAPPVLLITDRRQARRPLTDTSQRRSMAVVAGYRCGRRTSGAGAGSACPRDRPPGGALRRLCAAARRAAPRSGPAAPASISGRRRRGAARALLHPSAWVSISAHSTEEVFAAAEAGADAVTLSPIFASASKPGYGPALGLERLAEVAAVSPLPVIALGGIEDEGSVRACLDAGAAAVAVMGAAMRAADPALCSRV